jgi:hypothetical protein
MNWRRPLGTPEVSFNLRSVIPPPEMSLGMLLATYKPYELAILETYF